MHAHIGRLCVVVRARHHHQRHGLYTSWHRTHGHGCIALAALSPWLPSRSACTAVCLEYACIVRRRMNETYVCGRCGENSLSCGPPSCVWVLWMYIIAASYIIYKPHQPSPYLPKYKECCFKFSIVAWPGFHTNVCYHPNWLDGRSSSSGFIRRFALGETAMAYNVE